MKEDWKEVTLGEVTDVINGFAFKSKDFVTSGVPLVKIKELKEKRINLSGCDFLPNDFTVNEKFTVNKGEVIIALTGSHITLPSSAVGRVAKSYIDERLFLNQRVGKFKVFEDKCDVNYLYFVLTSDYFFNSVGLLAKGAANQANISGDDIKSIKIILPPLETQRKIASILSGYDDLIENNLKRIKILEEMAQQTYEEWFVRMRFPGYETAVFDKSGLPEGWEKVKLGEVAKINQSTIKKGFKGKIKYIDIASVSPNMIGDLIEYEFEDAPGRARRIVSNGDTIWSCVRPNRKSYALIINPEENLIASTGFCVITAKKVPFVYLHHALTTDEFIGYLTNLAGGAAYPAVTQNNFEDADIIVPTEDLIKKFSQTFEPTKYIIQNLKSQNQCLREVRDILLPRLMMGTIDVESLESKPTDAKVILFEQPKKEVSKEFKEAVLIACLTERFGNAKFPLGRKRYTKLSYLFHRYSDNKIQDYLRKAAGPYNPKTKYGGPEKIALNSKYIQNWKGEKGTTGFAAAEKIEDAKKYFSNYWQITDLDWLTAEFKFKSNDELELLATVDNSLIELSKNNLELTTANILNIIKSEKEWEAKLERTIFSDANVEKAIGFLRGVLDYGNNQR